MDNFPAKVTTEYSPQRTLTPTTRKACQDDIFVGIIVKEPIRNQKRYEMVLNLILQYLETHKKEVNTCILQNQWIELRQNRSAPTTTVGSIPAESSLTHTLAEVQEFLNQGGQVNLPCQCYNLNTSFHRLGGPLITQPDFQKVIWETLNILIENFPSHLALYQSNLDETIMISDNETLRRQVSLVRARAFQFGKLTLDELKDSWHVFTIAERLRDGRAMQNLLEVFVSINNQNWKLFKQILDSNLLISIVNDSKQTVTCKRLAQTLVAMDTERAGQNNSSEQTFDEPKVSIEKDASSRVLVFQLSESGDLNRVTALLEHLATTKDIVKLTKTANLHSILVELTQKYCNGEYGFDSVIARNGGFQMALIKILVYVSANYAAFQTLMSEGILDYFGQILEEAVIYAVEDSKAGIETQQVPFLLTSLDLVSLTLSKHFIEFLTTVGETIKRLINRLDLVTQRKSNKVLAHFTAPNGLITDQDQLYDDKTDHSLFQNCEGLLTFKKKLYNLNLQYQAVVNYSNCNEEYDQHEGLHQNFFGQIMMASKDLGNDTVDYENQQQNYQHLESVNQSQISELTMQR